MARFRTLLFKNRNFGLLWLAQIISNFGDRISQMALIALVYGVAPGSSLALAKAMSFTIIPVFVIGPVAGAWVDRWDKKDVMVISDILRGLLAFALPFCIARNNLPLVYLIIFLLFSISRFFISSKMAIIPELVAREELLAANSLADTTKMIGNAIGLVVAGLIVHVQFIGATGGFVIYGISSFASAALMGMIVRKEFLVHLREDLIIATQALEHSIRKSIFAEIREGVLVMVRRRAIRFIVFTLSFLMAGAGAIYCVIITFVQDSFGNATKDLSFLIFSLLMGLLAGTVLYGRLGGNLSKKKVILLSFVTSGLSVIVFTLAVRSWPNLLLAGALSFGMGLAASPIMVSANTFAHEMTPEDVRGKVFSSLEAVIHLAFLVFMFLTGLLEHSVGKMVILVGSGAVFSLFGLAGFLVETRRRTTSR